MPKKDIHPKWFTDTKVKVNGEVVMTVSSTREELNVDLWSGNHPFFTGSQKVIDTEGRIERFLRKFDKNNVKMDPRKTKIFAKHSPAVIHGSKN